MAKRMTRSPAAVFSAHGCNTRSMDLLTEAELELRVDAHPIAHIWRIPGHDVELAKGYVAATAGSGTRVNHACYCSGAVDGRNPYNLLDLTLEEAPAAASPAWEAVSVTQLDDFWDRFAEVMEKAHGVCVLAGVQRECITAANALDKAAGARDLAPEQIIGVGALITHQLIARAISHGAPKVMVSPVPPTSAAAHEAAAHGIAIGTRAVSGNWTIYGAIDAITNNSNG